MAVRTLLRRVLGDEAISRLDFVYKDGALPGVFGVAQRVADILTQERHGPRPLRAAAVAFDISATLYGYEYDKERAEEGSQQLSRGEQWLKENGYTLPADAPYKLRAIVEHELMHAKWERRVFDKDVVYTTVANGISIASFVPAGGRNDGDHDNEHRVKPGVMPVLLRYEDVKSERAGMVLVRCVQGLVRARLGTLLTVREEYKNHDHVLVLKKMDLSSGYVPDNHGGTYAQLAERIAMFHDRHARRNVILKGEPGCGKSMFARHTALTIGKGRVLHIPLNEMDDRLGSDSMSALLLMAAPDVVVLDDIDRALQRGQATAMMLAFVEANVTTLIASVNTIKDLDPALLRSGRFDEVRKVGNPDWPHTVDIANAIAAEWGLNVTDEMLEIIRERDFSPAEVNEVISAVGTLTQSTDAAAAAAVFTAEAARVAQQKLLYADKFKDDMDDTEYDA